MFVVFRSCLCLEALSILLSKWLRMKGGSSPPPPTRRVSWGGGSAETVVNGAAQCSLWLGCSMLSPFLAKRTLRDCVMTKPRRFRKKKRGRKLCKTGVSQTATLSLYTVLLNGAQVWEQGNQEGVLLPLLLAEPVSQILVEAVAVSPPQAAHENHLAGSVRCTQSTQPTSCLICLWSC